MNAHNKRLAVIGLIIAVLLTIPLIAMQLTQEVNWSVFDFGVAALLLTGTGIGYELITRRVQPRKRQRIFIGALFCLLGVVWAELAVGIF